MKQYLIISIFCSMLAMGADAQPVPKRVVVEHYTNTFCPPCASRNPGLYANIASNPGIYHVSYHPSAPYPACTLYQHNPSENDARTNHYGIYGATPRVVINGSVIPSSTQFTDSTLFDAALGQFTPFDIKVELTIFSSTTLTVKTTIYREDTGTFASPEIYGVIAEDTLAFVTNNGEPVHYDVFRKGIWAAGPITAQSFPSAVGDSVVYTQNVTVNNAWDMSKVYAMVMLSSGNDMLQVGKSNDLPFGLNVTSATAAGAIKVFPNPATDRLSIGNIKPNSVVTVMNMNGAVQKQFTAVSGNEDIDVSALASGLYMLSVQDNECVRHVKFVKQ
jgi:hypothetical protein